MARALAGSGGSVLVRGGPTAIDDDWREPTAVVRVTWRDTPGELDRLPEGADAVLHRGWVAVYRRPEARGVAVLLPGMFGTPRWIIEAWTDALLSRGWSVVRLVTQPSRFTERVTFDLSDDEPAEARARQVAGVIDLRLWACGAVIEAGLRVLHQDQPELRDRPRIAFGLSGGAIALPAVVGREPDRYAACIMVSGGADFMSIAATSAYAPFIAAARFRDGPGPAAASRVARVAEAYRRVARFDPYALAPRLEGVPTLLVHGALDRAVPAEQGDLLWKRLGEPERWSFPVGHEWLAISLPDQFDAMLDWVDGAVERSERAAEP